MRKYSLISPAICVCVLCVIGACRKETKAVYWNIAADSSHVSITNASPAVSNLQLYLNNKLVSLPNSPLTYGKTVFSTYITNASTYHPDTALLPYINIPAGYQQLSFGSSDNNNILNVLNKNFNSEKNYSVFITDTIVHGHVTSIVLEDNVQKVDSTHGQMRFLNLSPDAPPLDLWAYPGASYSGNKIFSNCAYLPNDFNSVIAGQSFYVLDAGPYYCEATIAGTTNVVLGGILLIPPKTVMTLYTKGYMGGTGNNALSVGVIQYTP